MRISSQPIVSIPAYVKEQSVTLPLAGDAVLLRNTKMLGGPVGSIGIYGLNKSNFEAAKADQQQAVLSLIRFISKPLADHIGHHADAVNRCIWLYFDFKALRDQLRAHPSDKAQNLITATALLSDAAGTIALVPKLEGAEKVADICKFFELAGDQAQHGGLAWGTADINRFMAEYGGDEMRQKLLEGIEAFCDEDTSKK